MSFRHGGEDAGRGFPLHVTTAWIGNSQLVARKHYLQVTDEHFAHAAQNEAHWAKGEA